MSERNVHALFSALRSDVPSGQGQPGQGGTVSQADEAQTDGGGEVACRGAWLPRYVNCLGLQVWLSALGLAGGWIWGPAGSMLCGTHVLPLVLLQGRLVGAEGMAPHIQARPIAGPLPTAGGSVWGL